MTSPRTTRTISTVLALTIWAATVPAAAAPVPSGLRPIPEVADWPDPPRVTADAYLLADMETGQVLAARNAGQLRPVASTVKLLTAITVLAHRPLDEVVAAGSEVSGVEGAKTGLQPGDRRTVRELLEALLVRSGNDAALALAIHIGGSVPAFIDLMHEQARHLGLGELVLSTPSGLEDQNRLSAEQLAMLSRAAMSDARIRQIAELEAITLPRLGVMHSRNELLGAYAGATGVKTGYTDEAGWSVIGSARRGGRELIAVVLASESPASRFAEAAELMDHGFREFRPSRVQFERRLRVAGGWVVQELDPYTAVLPVRSATLEVTPALPIGIPETGSSQVPVRWGKVELATVPLSTRASDRETVTPVAQLGRSIVDRAYTALRAATAHELWKDAGSGR